MVGRASWYQGWNRSWGADSGDGLESDVLGSHLPLTRGVLLGKSFFLSEPQFLHLVNGDKNISQRAVAGMKLGLYAKHLL